MKRRGFIKITAVSAIGVAAAAAGGVAWLGSGAPPQVLTIDAALRHIDILRKGSIASTGSWNAFQVFSHCAQTVEFSMAGYPKPKSAAFQATAGKLAFAAFSSQQKMKHNIAEPIDGAPALPVEGDPKLALERLHKAFTDFQQFQGVLAPHFAYGALSKDDYALAHVLHFSNHLEEIQGAS
jgi:hypothetical protein